MKMKGPWMGDENEYRYKYNGIEEVDDFGLDLSFATYRKLDPAIGRWFQVDPKGEATFDLTPYGSMNQNPVSFTDPDGDIAFLGLLAIGAVIVGTGNVVAKAAAGDINNFGDGFEAFGTGAVAGAAITAGGYFGLQVPVLGAVIKGAAAVKATTTGLSVASGVGQGIFGGDWSALENAGEIFLGNFYSDPERSFLGQALQLTSRHSWELLQTEVGHGFSQLRNTFGGVDRVDLYRGVTFSQSFNNENPWGGISLGNFVNTKRRIPDLGGNLSNDVLLQHEYGHTFDSHIFGPLYLIGIGIPSAAGAQWTEDRADNFWDQYLLRNPF